MLVSVIVPIYKTEKYIARCLESLIRQDFMDMEIICVDDGSPDRSGEIAGRYAAKDARIRVIHQKNAGLGMARNAGLDIASGKYVMFVDSDDYIDSELIRALAEAAEQNDADTVIAGYTRDASGRRTGVLNSLADHVYTGHGIFTEVLQKMVGPLRNGTDTVNMAVWRVLFSGDLIRENHLRFPSEREFISEDIIFDLHYYPLCRRVCGIADTGYCYCQNENSLTEQYHPNRFEMGKKLFFEKKRILEELGEYVCAKDRAEESFLQYTRYSIKSEVKYAWQHGRKRVIRNIERIIQDPALQQVVRCRSGGYRSMADRMIDIGIRLRNAGLIYRVLYAGYRIRGR